MYFFHLLNFVSCRHCQWVDAFTTKNFGDVTSSQAVIDIRESRSIFWNFAMGDIPLPGVNEFRTAGFVNLSCARSDRNQDHVSRIFLPNMLSTPALSQSTAHLNRALCCRDVRNSAGEIDFHISNPARAAACEVRKRMVSHHINFRTSFSKSPVSYFS